MRYPEYSKPLARPSVQKLKRFFDIQVKKGTKTDLKSILQGGQTHSDPVVIIAVGVSSKNVTRAASPQQDEPVTVGSY